MSSILSRIEQTGCICFQSAQLRADFDTNRTQFVGKATITVLVFYPLLDLVLMFEVVVVVLAILFSIVIGCRLG